MRRLSWKPLVAYGGDSSTGDGLLSPEMVIKVLRVAGLLRLRVCRRLFSRVVGPGSERFISPYGRRICAMVFLLSLPMPGAWRAVAGPGGRGRLLRLQRPGAVSHRGR